MIRLLLCCILVGASGLGHAMSPSGHSAYRAPGASYRAYIATVPFVGPHYTTPVGAAVQWGQPLPSATTWESYSAVVERFKKVRDYRWMTIREQPGFLRRISWIYPDDGCFARAGLAILNFANWAVDLPKKVFVFGDLLVQTPNSPSGEVGWWYHVAPIVEVNQQKYVLDPAMDPNQPMKLEDWVGAMGDPADMRVAICASGTYTPDDNCAQHSDGIEAMAVSDQPYYLRAERARILQLHRNANEELGDNPPWN
jgi:Glutaminase